MTVDALTQWLTDLGVDRCLIVKRTLWHVELRYHNHRPRPVHAKGPTIADAIAVLRRKLEVIANTERRRAEEVRGGRAVPGL
jgi:hypothetical protein